MRVPNPWGVLERTDLRLVRAPIAEQGRYYHHRRAIVVRTGLLLREERAVLWHELVHHRRGDAACDTGTREDGQVDREAARWAMPWPVLRWGVDGAHDLHDLVDRMKVTEYLVRVRLASLHPAERAHVLARARVLREAA